MALWHQPRSYVAADVAQAVLQEIEFVEEKEGMNTKNLSYSRSYVKTLKNCVNAIHKGQRAEDEVDKNYGPRKSALYQAVKEVAQCLEVQQQVKDAAKNKLVEREPRQQAKMQEQIAAAKSIGDCMLQVDLQDIPTMGLGEHVD